MKKLIPIIITLFFCFFYVSCNNSKNKKDVPIYERMSLYTQSPISNQLPDINRSYEYEERDTIKYVGFCSPVKDETDAYKFVIKEKDYFYSNGYLLFYFADNEYKFYLGAIKSNNPMDILKWRGTDGINYDHTNQDIINKLEEWGKTNPINILGVSYDWVYLSFTNPVDNVEEFANDVYNFCPDAVDQGTETIEALAATIKERNQIFLWWD